jgi:hypothetical protein
VLVLPSYIYNLPLAVNHLIPRTALERYSRSVKADAPRLPSNISNKKSSTKREPAERSRHLFQLKKPHSIVLRAYKQLLKDNDEAIERVRKEARDTAEF